MIHQSDISCYPIFDLIWWPKHLGLLQLHSILIAKYMKSIYILHRRIGSASAISLWKLFLLIFLLRFFDALCPFHYLITGELNLMLVTLYLIILSLSFYVMKITERIFHFLLPDQLQYINVLSLVFIRRLNMAIIYYLEYYVYCIYCCRWKLW